MRIRRLIHTLTAAALVAAGHAEDANTAPATPGKPGTEAPKRARRWDYPATKTAVKQIALERIPLPPLPEGVTELKFDEFYQMPVGPHGLDVTEKVRGLNGKKVRIVGFQVREEISNCNSCVAAAAQPGKKKRPTWMEHLVPGRMLLVPAPSVISMGHYGLCDDLPPQTLYVDVPEFFGEPVPFTPGVMLLTGTLAVGSKQEADGRISVLRLTLDSPTGTNPTTNIKIQTP